MTRKMQEETRHMVALTEAEHDLISGICHDWKDGHRGDKSSLLPVMALERKITGQTGGAYHADPAYDWNPPAECFGAKLDRELTEKSEHFTVYRDDSRKLPLFVLETGQWYREAEFETLEKEYGE